MKLVSNETLRSSLAIQHLCFDYNFKIILYYFYSIRENLRMLNNYVPRV